MRNVLANVVVVACLRLTDSKDDALVKDTRKYERVIWTGKGGGGGSSSPQFPPVLTTPGVIKRQRMRLRAGPTYVIEGALSQKFSNYGILQEVGLFYNVEMI